MAEEGGKGAVQEDQGEKTQKDGENSLWAGPVKKRCCTDIVCIPIFFAHIALFWLLTLMNAGTGDPMKLILPRDYKGGYCGIAADGQWNSNMDLTNMKKLMWSMNMDEAFGPVAKEMVCSAVGRAAVVQPGLDGSIAAANKVTEAEFKAYCGLSEMPTLMDAAAAAQKLQDDVNNKIAQYTDPAQAAKLFSGGGSSAGTSIMKEITKYFNMVCTSTCSMGQNTTSATRSYTYKPNPAMAWGTDLSYRSIGLWDKFLAEVLAKQPDMAAKFTFKAWDATVCPYSDKLCVATPGVTFSELGDWNMCTPKIDAGVMSSLSGAAGESLDGLAKLSITEDASKSIGDVIGDVIKTYQVFIIVAVLSMVVGLLTLVLMRFILCPMVWGSLILIFLIFVAGGLALMVRSNQCADETFTEAAAAQKDAGFNATMAGNATNPFDQECVGGYSIENSNAREAAKYCGYILLGIAALWLLGILVMVCRIRLAIAVNQVACMFLYSNPQVLLVPIIQNFIGTIWILVWMFCAAFLLSQVAEDIVPTTAFATYAEAYGTADVEGKCTNFWPPGDVFVDDSAETCSGATPLCYKCSSPRFVFDWKFGYSFFSFLWHNFFFVAVGQCTIAGAVGIWFFTAKGEKWKKSTVLVGWKNAVFHHTGSLAFGSLILAIVVWLKYFMTWLAQQAKQTKNKVMELVCKILAYVLYCFEKCVKFLNKNAYIQIALMGTNFCKSAKNAFFLILRNFARFGIIAMLAHIVHFIGMVLITAATAVLGYLILGAMYPDVNPIVPTICYTFIGWMTAKLFIGTFGLAVDATLQCFIAAEEMDAGNDFAPGPLKEFIAKNADSDDNKSKCCDACTIM